MDRIFWQRQVHSGADAEVGIRGVNALQLDCVQHILGRQVRPLEEKADSRTRRQTEKIARFLRSAEEVRVIKKQGELDEFYRETGMRTEQTLQQKR